MRITLVASLIGVGSVASLGMGWLVARALPFHLRYVIACFDAKVARVWGVTSEWGGSRISPWMS